MYVSLHSSNSQHFVKRDSQIERLYTLGHAFVDLYDEFEGTLPQDLKSLLENFEQENSVKQNEMKLYSWAQRDVWGGPNYFLADECLNSILKSKPAVIWDTLPEHEKEYVIFQWRGMREAFVELTNQVEILAN